MYKVIIALCNINFPTINGDIYFLEDKKKGIVHIIGRLESNYLKNSYHGFHIHEAGDLSDNCSGACSHFNPYNKNHGGPNDVDRHVGDLGNIYFNENGICNINMIDSYVQLSGEKANIIGRSIVIHNDKEYLGKGIGNDRKESLKTGNAGKRIACGIIGYSKLMFTK